MLALRYLHVLSSKFNNQMTAHFTDKTFKADVLDSSIPVLVDFYAEWCGPCKMMEPMITELAKEFDGKVLIGKMNVDEESETPQSYGVQSIPTFAFIKNGEVVEKLVGGQSKSTMLASLNALL